MQIELLGAIKKINSEAVQKEINRLIHSAKDAPLKPAEETRLKELLGTKTKE